MSENNGYSAALKEFIVKSSRELLEDFKTEEALAEYLISNGMPEEEAMKFVRAHRMDTEE